VKTEDIEWAPEMIALGEALETYPSTTTTMGYPALKIPGVTYDCIRCKECDGVVYHDPETALGRAYHLATEHGYYMDGRRHADQS
jgi:hypothetical protein